MAPWDGALELLKTKTGFLALLGLTIWVRTSCSLFGAPGEWAHPVVQEDSPGVHR